MVWEPYASAMCEFHSDSGCQRRRCGGHALFDDRVVSVSPCTHAGQG